MVTAIGAPAIHQHLSSLVHCQAWFEDGKKHRFSSSVLRLKQNGRPAARAVCDPELHRVLKLASDQELTELSGILYGRSILSPLFKSVAPGDGSRSRMYLDDDDEEEREELLERLESRILFLAADARSTVSGRRPKYRDVLLQVRRKLSIRCSSNLSTEDLEAEIFLFLLYHYSRKKAEKDKAPKSQSWTGYLSASLRLGSRDIAYTMLKGGSALTVSTLQRIIARDISGKVIVETARYQLAKEALKKGGQLFAARLEQQAALLTAKELLTGAVAQYAALRGTAMLIGPFLWGTFAADVVLRAFGTDYARVVRAIYALAQIRLTRSTA